MPMLLTSTSTSGSAAISAAQPAALPRSAAIPWTTAPDTSCFSRAVTASTRASVRPLTVTTAPSRARARAVANPMPAVDPVTSARFPFSPRSIRASV